MSTTKTITLLAGARNVKIETIQDNITTIVFNCTTWKDKNCYHKVSGSWKIKSVKLNKVTLTSNDTVIKSKPYNIKNIQPLIID